MTLYFILNSSEEYLIKTVNEKHTILLSFEVLWSVMAALDFNNVFHGKFLNQMRVSFVKNFYEKREFVQREMKLTNILVELVYSWKFLNEKIYDCADDNS